MAFTLGVQEEFLIGFTLWSISRRTDNSWTLLLTLHGETVVIPSEHTGIWSLFSTFGGWFSTFVDTISSVSTSRLAFELTNSTFRCFPSHIFVALVAHCGRSTLSTTFSTSNAFASGRVKEVTGSTWFGSLINYTSSIALVQHVTHEALGTRHGLSSFVFTFLTIGDFTSFTFVQMISSRIEFVVSKSTLAVDSSIGTA